MENRVKTPVTKTKSKSCPIFRLLGTILTILDIEIKGNKLPTTKQILLSFLALLETKSKPEAVKEELNKTFKLWPRNVLDRIDNDEDKAFFQSMITDRKWSMAGKDQPLAKQEAQALERKIADEKRRENVKKN